jgi:hypothetical protein
MLDILKFFLKASYLFPILLDVYLFFLDFFDLIFLITHFISYIFLIFKHTLSFPEFFSWINVTCFDVFYFPVKYICFPLILFPIDLLLASIFYLVDFSQMFNDYFGLLILKRC